MPWNMTDYTDSMKNFDSLMRKKAIEIANALEAEGYPDERLIPIAQAQAKEWFENATAEEKEAFNKEENPKKSDKHESTANIDLLDNDVKVIYEEDVWKVKTAGAKRAAETFDKKAEAVKRGEEIARNKESTLIIYKRDGSVQDRRKFD